MGAKKYYTVTEAAKLLGVTRQAIHKRIKKGDLSHLRMGNQYLIPAKTFNYITKRSSRSKMLLVDKAVAKTVKEYSETLKLMAAEEHENNNNR
jgi:excisionase family DNA binding protein